MTKEIIDGVEIDYSDLEAKYQVKEESTFDTVLIIDHLPKIDKAKEEKLVAVLCKNVFTPAKAVPLPESILMPRGGDEMSKGYMFVEFESVEQATAAQQAANGYRLDKSHVLSAVFLSDFERLTSLAEEYKEVVVEPFEEREYLKSWLNDEYARDQFVTLAGKGASVSWTARNGMPPELVHARDNWTDSYVQWSTRGSYLATVHAQGIMLWGGSSFARLGKFPHPNVKLVSFSNTENVMVSWSPHDEACPSQPNLMVWDVMAGKLVRGFIVEEAEAGGKTASTVSWPMVKFSHEDKYAARVHDSAIHVYELPECTLLEKKAVKVEGLKDFSWSPVDQAMVHWTVGTEDIPTRVSLMSLPSRLVTRTKNLFNVNTCQVHWQSRGDYLCVQVERHSKNKKQVFSNVELFRMREKGIPIDTLEFKDAPLVAFSWEPEGDRFLTACTLEFKTTISFYTMKAMENNLSQVKLISTIERKVQNRFLWSPRGDFLLFHHTDSNTATLEFFSVNDMTTLANRDQFLGTDAAWDPSGRFVASWVSAWKQSSDHGYILWDLRGEQVHRQNIKMMSFLGWRPRPPTLLSKEVQKEIRRNLKNYSSAFEEDDLRELSQESSNTAEMKSRTMMVWNEWRRHCRREYETRNAARKSLIGREEECVVYEPLTDVMEEWIEELVEETVEVIDQ